MVTQVLEAQQRTNLYQQNVVLTRPADSTELSSKVVFKPGKEPVVIAFWLTTCPPCMREFDAYTREYDNWKQQANFKMVGISIDFPNRFGRINEIAKEKKLPFEVFWDGDRSFKDILPGELNGLPQVFVFSPDGQLVCRTERTVPQKITWSDSHRRFFLPAHATHGGRQYHYYGLRRRLTGYSGQYYCRQHRRICDLRQHADLAGDRHRLDRFAHAAGRSFAKAHQ